MRFSATTPESTRSLCSNALSVDSATDRPAAASATATMASATRTSTSVNPRTFDMKEGALIQRDATKRAAPQGDFRAAPGNRRLDRAAQAVGRDDDSLAGLQWLGIELHCAERYARGQRAPPVRTVGGKALPFAILAFAQERIAVRGRRPRDALTAR